MEVIRQTYDVENVIRWVGKRRLKDHVDRMADDRPENHETCETTEKMGKKLDIGITLGVGRLLPTTRQFYIHRRRRRRKEENTTMALLQ